MVSVVEVLVRVIVIALAVALRVAGVVCEFGVLCDLLGPIVRSRECGKPVGLVG
jgi:hypothetical protein